MKFIINTTNLRMGGALQRANSFLNELKIIGKDQYHIFISDGLKNQLNLNSFPKNIFFYYFKNSPANLKYRRKLISQFNQIEKKIEPNLIFSFVGPCYWKPKTTHLVGFGIPHIVYSDYSYVRNYSIKTKLEMFYKKYWTKKEADFFVVQTEDVRKRLSERINVSVSDIFLVSNGPGVQYSDIRPSSPKKNNLKKLLLISTYRPSKNFEIINDIIPLLKNDIFSYEFHLTIKNKDYEKIFKGKEKWIKNHGPTLPKDCPELYNNCDAMFLPSHLECFSASYPEAMIMQRPILTSDLSFARTVCKDAALYFDNLNPWDIAEKIKLLFHDTKLYYKLIDNGEKRLNVFNTSRAPAEKYLNIFKKIIKTQKNI